MSEAKVATPASRTKKRFRFGLRGLLGSIVVLGIIFGLIAAEARRVQSQARVVAELARMSIYGDGRPTLLCFIAMKLHSTDSLAIEAKYAGWLDRGWFNKAKFFNAGHLADEKVPAVVRLIERFGIVKEVLYNEPPLKGLRLFYIDEIPYHALGVPRESCTFREYSPTGEAILR